MPVTAAGVGYSTILKKETSTPGTYTDYGFEITSLNGVGFSRSSQDATHMQSPDGYTEFVHGIKTAKPVSLEVNWLPSVTGALQTLLEGAKANWQILFPDNSTCTFNAQATDVEIGALTPDGKMTATLTLTPSGKPTWA